MTFLTSSYPQKTAFLTTLFLVLVSTACGDGGTSSEWCDISDVRYNGECIPSCPAGLERCQQSCCGSTETCDNGVCVPNCDVGAACGTGLVCNAQNRCVEGCFIDGTYHPHGAVNPWNACLACGAANVAGWTAHVQCPSGQVCHDGACSLSCPSELNQCGATCCSASEICSGGICVLACQIGQVCGSGMVCDGTNQCVEGCYIGDTLHSHGTENPSNACEWCSATNPTGWSRKPAGTVNPKNPCESCETSSAHGWTQKEVGATCGDGRVCNASGACVLGCASGGAIVAHGERNPSNVCQECSSTSEWKARIGADCAVGSGTRCNGLGECIRPPQISAGESHTCGITSTGGLLCWGANSYGQLGDGSKTDRWTPTQVVGLGSSVVAVAAGGRHTCAVLVTGAVQCWGSNWFGQGATDNVDDHVVPTNVNTVPGLTGGAVAVSAGFRHTCALTSAGRLFCWGYNLFGQLGTRSEFEFCVEPATVYGAVAGVSSVSVGSLHTCAVHNGHPGCWGDNSQGQIGNALIGEITYNEPVWIDWGFTKSVASIAAGQHHSCAITAAGETHCWGSNGWGQLGLGKSYHEETTPALVSGITTRATEISAGADHTCAVTSDGTIICWGRNSSGQIGDDTTETKFTPTQVSGISAGSTSVSSGALHTCAISVASSAQAFCWGDNSKGQLGNGATTNRLVPTLVVGFP